MNARGWRTEVGEGLPLSSGAVLWRQLGPLI